MIEHNKTISTNLFDVFQIGQIVPSQFSVPVCQICVQSRLLELVDVIFIYIVRVLEYFI